MTKILHRLAEIRARQAPGRPSRDYYLREFGAASYIFHDYEDVPYLLDLVTNPSGVVDAARRALIEVGDESGGERRYLARAAVAALDALAALPAEEVRDAE